MRFSRLVPLLALGLSALACAPSNVGPELRSSAGQGSYAIDYPTTLTGSVAKLAAKQQDVRATMAAYPRYPDALKDPKWSLVLGVIDKAAEAGRSASYVEERRSLDHARAFFTDEQREISGKVAGAVQYAAQGCKIEGGVVGASLKDAVDKRIEKRRNGANDAHLAIEREARALGKENVAALEKQADEITDATYAVYVELVDEKARMRAMLADGDKVRRTMDDFLAAEGAYQAEAGRTDVEKKASTERVQAMNKSKAEVGRAVEQGRATEKRVDDDLARLTKDYEASFAALRQAVAARVKKLAISQRVSPS